MFTRSTLAYLASGFLLAGEVGLRFAPEQGLSTQKTFTTHVDSKLKHTWVRMWVDGREVRIPQQEEADARFTIESRAVVLDEIEALEDSGLMTVSRVFLELEKVATREITGTKSEDVSDEFILSSPLEGRAVRFIGQETAWDAAWADDGEKQNALLEELRFERSFSFLLPEEDVEPGGSWTLSEEAFMSLLSAIGDLSYEGLPEGGQKAMWKQRMLDAVEVEDFTLTLDSASDGRAEVSIAAEAASETEWHAEESAEDIDLHSRRTWQIEVEGILVWGLESNDLVSLELDFAWERAEEQRQVRQMDGQEVTAVKHVHYADQVKRSVAVE